MTWLQQLSSAELLQTAQFKCKSVRQEEILVQQEAPALLTNSGEKGKENKVNVKVDVTIYRIFA